MGLTDYFARKRKADQIYNETDSRITREDSEKLVDAYLLLDEINSLDNSMREKSDEDLKAYTSLFRKKIENGESIDSLLPEAFAVVRESARRIYGENGESEKESARKNPELCREIFGTDEYGNETGDASAKFGKHYDVQILGGIALHEGKVAEMYTGEGKTLTVTLPAYLNALSGKGIHVVTPNDYLARRDARWMAPLFNFLGMSVGVRHEEKGDNQRAWIYNPENIENNRPKKGSKKDAYDCDITYGTSSRFIFDFLDDNLIKDPGKKAQRDLYRAFIDEVDQILIDNSLIPHIISSTAGISAEEKKKTMLADWTARKLIERGLYEVDIDKKSATISEEGHEWMDDNIENYVSLRAGLEDIDFIYKVTTALSANTFFRRGKEYQVYKKELSDLENIAQQTAKLVQSAQKKIKTSLYNTDEIEKTAEITGYGLEWIEKHSERLESSISRIEQNAVKRDNEKLHNIFDSTGEILLEMQNEDVLYYAECAGVEARAENLHLIEEEAKKQANEKIKEIFLGYRNVLANIRQIPDFVSYINEALSSVVMNNGNRKRDRAVIIDQSTGRPKPSNRWKDGLHPAVEAKEGINIRGEGVTTGVITTPFYFAKYEKISGMTGTAKDSRKEFAEHYGLDVVSIPTNNPLSRVDYIDVLCRTKDAKRKAVVDEIIAWHSIGRPVLVGTVSDEEANILADMLRKKGLKKEDYSILNSDAENLEREAEIVSNAGKKGAVTISTNMAGRGTDISLEEGIEEIGRGFEYDVLGRNLYESENGTGGLVVLGTERHPSPRIDKQLRGRAGRQGDEGMTRFYISPEDYLFTENMKEFSRWVLNKLAQREFKRHEADAVPSKVFNDGVSKAQRTIEESNQAERKNLFEYDSLLEKQRNVVYSLRDMLISGGSASDFLFEALEDTIKHVAANADQKTEEFVPLLSGFTEYCNLPEEIFGEDFRAWITSDKSFEIDEEESISREEIRNYLFKRSIDSIFGTDILFNDDAFNSAGKKKAGEYNEDENKKRSCRLAEEIDADDIVKQIEGKYSEFTQGMSDLSKKERNTLLDNIDAYWTEHLTRLESLRESVGLRVYAQKKPFFEYLKDSTEMFENFISYASSLAISSIMQKNMFEDEVRKIEMLPEIRDLLISNVSNIVEGVKKSAGEGCISRLTAMFDMDFNPEKDIEKQIIDKYNERLSSLGERQFYLNVEKKTLLKYLSIDDSAEIISNLKKSLSRVSDSGFNFCEAIEYEFAVENVLEKAERDSADLISSFEDISMIEIYEKSRDSAPVKEDQMHPEGAGYFLSLEKKAEEARERINENSWTEEGLREHLDSFRAWYETMHGEKFSLGKTSAVDARNYLFQEMINEIYDWNIIVNADEEKWGLISEVSEELKKRDVENEKKKFDHLKYLLNPGMFIDDAVQKALADTMISMMNMHRIPGITKIASQ